MPSAEIRGGDPRNREKFVAREMDAARPDVNGERGGRRRDPLPLLSASA
jgi:hypothetical protein